MIIHSLRLLKNRSHSTSFCRKVYPQKSGGFWRPTQLFSEARATSTAATADNEVFPFQHTGFSGVFNPTARLRELIAGAQELDGWDVMCFPAKMHVYRLLRPEDEDPEEGLFPTEDADWSVSPKAHIEQGSRIKTRYISTSKNHEVCLFYASKSIHERDIHHSKLYVAEINLDLNLDLSKCHVWDVSGDNDLSRIQRFALDIDKRSQAYNYAKMFEEVIIDRPIDKSEIVRVRGVPGDLPPAENFRAFCKRRSIFI